MSMNDGLRFKATIEDGVTPQVQKIEQSLRKAGATDVEIKMFLRAYDEATPKIQEAQKQLDRLPKQQIINITANTQQMHTQVHQGVTKLQQEVSQRPIALQFTDNLKDVFGKVRGLSSNLSLPLASALPMNIGYNFYWGLGAGALAGAGAGVGSLAQNAIGANSSMEQSMVTLQQTLKDNTQSHQEAAKLIGIAQKTPFNYQDLLSADVRLRSYQIPALPSDVAGSHGKDPTKGQGYLSVAGNMAAAMNTPVSQAVEAIADARQGYFVRLLDYGIRMQQQDFQPGGKFAGLTFEQGLQRQTKRFAGAQDMQSQTYQGIQSNLHDVMQNQILRPLGTVPFAALKQVAGGIYNQSNNPKWENNIGKQVEQAQRAMVSFFETVKRGKAYFDENLKKPLEDVLVSVMKFGKSVGSAFGGTALTVVKTFAEAVMQIAKPLGGLVNGGLGSSLVQLVAMFKALNFMGFHGTASPFLNLTKSLNPLTFSLKGALGSLLQIPGALAKLGTLVIIKQFIDARQATDQLRNSFKDLSETKFDNLNAKITLMAHGLNQSASGMQKLVTTAANGIPITMHNREALAVNLATSAAANQRAFGLDPKMQIQAVTDEMHRTGKYDQNSMQTFTNEVKTAAMSAKDLGLSFKDVQNAMSEFGANAGKAGLGGLRGGMPLLALRQGLNHLPMTQAQLDMGQYNGDTLLQTILGSYSSPDQAQLASMGGPAGFDPVYSWRKAGLPSGTSGNFSDRRSTYQLNTKSFGRSQAAVHALAPSANIPPVANPWVESHMAQSLSNITSIKNPMQEANQVFKEWSANQKILDGVNTKVQDLTNTLNRQQATLNAYSQGMASLDMQLAAAQHALVPMQRAIEDQQLAMQQYEFSALRPLERALDRLNNAATKVDNTMQNAQYNMSKYNDGLLTGEQAVLDNLHALDNYNKQLQLLQLLNQQIGAQLGSTEYKRGYSATVKPMEGLTLEMQMQKAQRQQQLQQLHYDLTYGEGHYQMQQAARTANQRREMPLGQRLKGIHENQTVIDSMTVKQHNLGNQQQALQQKIFGVNQVIADQQDRLTKLQLAYTKASQSPQIRSLEDQQFKLQQATQKANIAITEQQTKIDRWNATVDDLKQQGQDLAKIFNTLHVPSGGNRFDQARNIIEAARRSHQITGSQADQAERELDRIEKIVDKHRKQVASKNQSFFEQAKNSITGLFGGDTWSMIGAQVKKGLDGIFGGGIAGVMGSIVSIGGEAVTLMIGSAIAGNLIRLGVGRAFNGVLNRVGVFNKLAEGGRNLSLRGFAAAGGTDVSQPEEMTRTQRFFAGRATGFQELRDGRKLGGTLREAVSDPFHLIRNFRQHFWGTAGAAIGNAVGGPFVGVGTGALGRAHGRDKTIRADFEELKKSARAVAKGVDRVGTGIDVIGTEVTKGTRAAAAFVRPGIDAIRAQPAVTRLEQVARETKAGKAAVGFATGLDKASQTVLKKSAADLKKAAADVKKGGKDVKKGGSDDKKGGSSFNKSVKEQSRGAKERLKSLGSHIKTFGKDGAAFGKRALTGGARILSGAGRFTREAGKFGAAVGAFVAVVDKILIPAFDDLKKLLEKIPGVKKAEHAAGGLRSLGNLWSKATGGARKLIGKIRRNPTYNDHIFPMGGAPEIHGGHKVGGATKWGGRILRGLGWAGNVAGAVNILSDLKHHHPAQALGDASWFSLPLTGTRLLGDAVHHFTGIHNPYSGPQDAGPTSVHTTGRNLWGHNLPMISTGADHKTAQVTSDWIRFHNTFAGTENAKQLWKDFVKQERSVGINVPSHAGGLNNVPYDGYLAELHKGEKVLPASTAQTMRSRKKSSEDMFAGDVSDLIDLAQKNILNKSQVASTLSSLASRSHAGGLSRVPYDGYLALLHQDEQVLPASLAHYSRSVTPASDSKSDAKPGQPSEYTTLQNHHNKLRTMTQDHINRMNKMTGDARDKKNNDRDKDYKDELDKQGKHHKDLQDDQTTHVTTTENIRKSAQDQMNKIEDSGYHTIYNTTDGWIAKISKAVKGIDSQLGLTHGNQSGSSKSKSTPPGHASGGLLKADPYKIGPGRIVRVNEEGHDEMIIPLAPHRRHRAFSLMKQAVGMMGGITGHERFAGGGIAKAHSAWHGHVFKGATSTFGPPTDSDHQTAYGHMSHEAGIAINPHGDGGWNSSLARSLAGHKFIVTVGGHSAVLPVIDKGPYAHGRIIDITGAGVRKLGMDPRRFPTGHIGYAAEYANGGLLHHAGLKAFANGGYVNPFPGGAGKSRIDMGADYYGSGQPIVAIGDALVTNVGPGTGGWGPDWINYTLSSGRYAGQHIYVAEHVNPLVKSGQRVKAGQKIGRFTGAIEIGFATGTGNSTLSMGASQGGDTHNTAPGVAMSNLIASLGGPSANPQAGGVTGTFLGKKVILGKASSGGSSGMAANLPGVPKSLQKMGAVGAVLSKALKKKLAKWNNVAGGVGGGATAFAGKMVPGIMNIAQQAAKLAGLGWNSAAATTIHNLLLAESNGGQNLPPHQYDAVHDPAGPFQVIGSTFKSFALPGHGNRMNPLDNAIAAMRYIKSAYGSIAGLEAKTHPHPGYPGYAGGIPRVPYDGFPALLHKDEAVVPAAAAHTARSRAKTSLADTNSQSNHAEMVVRQDEERANDVQDKIRKMEQHLRDLVSGQDKKNKKNELAALNAELRNKWAGITRDKSKADTALGKRIQATGDPSDGEKTAALIAHEQQIRNTLISRAVSSVKHSATYKRAVKKAKSAQNAVKKAVRRAHSAHSPGGRRVTKSEQHHIKALQKRAKKLAQVPKRMLANARKRGDADYVISAAHRGINPALMRQIRGKGLDKSQTKLYNQLVKELQKGDKHASVTAKQLRAQLMKEGTKNTKHREKVHNDSKKTHQKTHAQAAKAHAESKKQKDAATKHADKIATEARKQRDGTNKETQKVTKASKEADAKRSRAENKSDKRDTDHQKKVRDYLDRIAKKDMNITINNTSDGTRMSTTISRRRSK